MADTLQGVPAAERTHIAFFGIRNAGKSSLINAVTAQTVSVVSDTPGTTTDPVTKSMELLPLGPVVIIDTPGIDDEGTLGEARVARTREVLRKADIAVLVIDGSRACVRETESGAGETDGASLALADAEEELIAIFKERKIPFLVAVNKVDLITDTGDGFYVSALTGEGIHELKERLATLKKEKPAERPIVSDLVSPGDVVILVTPIDESAPKGRLILPQQLVLRELLDHGCIPVVAKDTEYEAALSALQQAPKLVITDSQVFEAIDKKTPETVPLTSFSILMARYKGTLEATLRGARKLDDLRDGDTVLISEGCTHHRQCKDIGTVKLPGWIDAYTGKKLHYEFTSGGTFPEDLRSFALIVHCGGCMLNEKEMASRAEEAGAQGIPMTNYGLAIAKMHGILEKSISEFSENL